MSWTVLVAPAEEPVSVAEMKLHARIDIDDDDAILPAYIAAARQHVENACEHALMPQTWRVFYRAFCAELQLPGGNVRDPVTVKYLDTDGAEQTVPAATYVVDRSRVPARISLAQGQQWPATRQQANAVYVDYPTGYANAAAVPAPLRAAVLLIAADLYENRESQVIGTIVADNSTAQSLMALYKRRQP
jgi:uncharacterized phiE125 gp8 family phage protein